MKACYHHRLTELEKVLGSLLGAPPTLPLSSGTSHTPLTWDMAMLINFMIPSLSQTHQREDH